MVTPTTKTVTLENLHVYVRTKVQITEILINQQEEILS